MKLVTILCFLCAVLAKKHLKSKTPVNVQAVQPGFQPKPAVFESPTISRHPTVVPFTRYGPRNRPFRSPLVSFQSANDDNMQRFGGYVRSPEMAGIQTIFHHTDPVRSVISTPAVVGARHEQTNLEILDKRTGQVTSHVLNNKQPIVGEVQRPISGVIQNMVRFNPVNKEFVAEPERTVTFHRNASMGE